MTVASINLLISFARQDATGGVEHKMQSRIIAARVKKQRIFAGYRIGGTTSPFLFVSDWELIKLAHCRSCGRVIEGRLVLAPLARRASRGPRNPSPDRS